jgi:hypothetical protein
VKSACFDDPNLVSTAGLVDAHVRVPGPAGAHAPGKVAALVAGMVAGADSFEDLAVLRHGAMDRLLPVAPAPTTLGTHLRAYAFGHVRQVDAVASRLLANLASMTSVLAGVEQVAWIDVDDTIKAMHGYAQQGVAYGYSGVKGLNAQLAVLSTPLAAPVIAGVRLRKGNVACAHGAPRLIADAVATARRAGAAGLAKATTATIRRRLIHIAARVVTTARRLHLPATWPWAAAFTNLFEATCGRPPAAST